VQRVAVGEAGELRAGELGASQPVGSFTAWELGASQPVGSFTAWELGAWEARLESVGELLAVEGTVASTCSGALSAGAEGGDGGARLVCSCAAIASLISSVAPIPSIRSVLLASSFVAAEDTGGPASPTRSTCESSASASS
jgi:hypothetical protein